MREIAIKRVKDNWIDEFSNLLDKVENKEFKKNMTILSVLILALSALGVYLSF